VSTFVALHPGCAATAHQDFPVGEWVPFCSAFPALALARRSHPSYHLGPNRATFGFIAVEQALRSCHKTLDDRPLGGVAVNDRAHAFEPNAGIDHVARDADIILDFERARPDPDARQHG
jgi:hypothetical protein